ncbi:MAG: YegS/Rv2252/BmrU family lipid kinase, partial [Anaerolineae bacterium]|nr:YegS/Rv2252/BmrU family lipid kinase [Anaerolineae bacterium]
AGGDGTCQEVINGMLAAAEPGTPIVGTMGILPVGSGCDFSWSIGVPTDLEGAIALLARAQTRVVDVGWLTADGESRYFDNNVGIGFEGVVTMEARKIKHLRGIALYLPAVLRSIFSSLHPAHSIVEYQNNTESHTFENKLLMLSVCNGVRAGGSFFIAPDAHLDDELFDVCVVRDIPRLRMLGLLPYFLRGTHTQQRDVTMLRTRRISVRSEDPLSAHADGEMLCEAAHHIECEIAPYKVQVIC